MLAGEKIRQIVYSEIKKIGKEKIQAMITSNIESSQQYIDIIMNGCIKTLSYESNDDDITIATLCEVLLHFMLTICTLPSERKIRVKTDLILDVIIPNLQSLKIKPDKAIIWLISAKPLLTKYTTYSVFPNTGSPNFSDIIIHIDNFLKEIRDK